MKEALKKIPLRVEKVDTLEFSVGVVLVLVSLLMPLAFNMHNFPVWHYLIEALRWSEKTFLMTAALLLVALNALRGIPHYVGAFFIGESIGFTWRGKKTEVLNAALTIALLRVVYRVIYLIYGVRYDFGLPAMLTRLRENAGMTQEEASKLFHVNRSTYAYYETGKSHPKYPLLCRIANAYEVSVDYLLGLKSAASNTADTGAAEGRVCGSGEFDKLGKDICGRVRQSDARVQIEELRGADVRDHRGAVSSGAAVHAEGMLCRDDKTAFPGRPDIR